MIGGSRTPRSFLGHQSSSKFSATAPRKLLPLHLHLKRKPKVFGYLYFCPPNFYATLTLFILSGGRAPKQAVVIATAVAKKRSALSNKADPAVPAPPSKRPRQEAETVCETPHPPKHVKKLAQNEEREIHVISSQTTEVTTPDAPLAAPATQDLLERRPIPVDRAPQVPPVLEMVEPVTAPNVPEVVETPVVSPVEETVALTPIVAPVLEMVAYLVERQSPQHPKR